MSHNKFNREAFLVWAKKKDKDEEFNYWSTDLCACGLYAHSLGLTYFELPLNFRMEIEACIEDADPEHFTFGALVKNLEDVDGR